MKRQKNVRKKSKISLSHYFQELKEGDKVALIRDLSFKTSFPKRMQGDTGTIVRKQGKAYIVRLLNGKTYKTLAINSIHLKKLK